MKTLEELRALWAIAYPKTIDRFRMAFSLMLRAQKVSLAPATTGPCPCCDGELAFIPVDDQDALGHSVPECPEFLEAMADLNGRRAPASHYGIVWGDTLGDTGGDLPN